MSNRSMRNLLHLVLLTATATLLSACAGAADTDTHCDGDAPTARIVGAAASIDGTSLVISGTASTSSGIAIRNIDIAGATATNGGFNFESFSATLSEGTWRQLAGSGDTLQVPITIRDACAGYSSTSSVALPAAYQKSSDAGAE